MLRYFRFLVLLFLVFSLIFSSCTANIYTVSQIQKKDALSKKLVNTKVKVSKYNDRVIIGYLCEVKSDSTIIRLNKEKNSRIAIPNHEIKLITRHKDVNKAALAAVACVLVIIILSAKGMTIGPSATK